MLMFKKRKEKLQSRKECQTWYIQGLFIEHSILHLECSAKLKPQPVNRRQLPRIRQMDCNEEKGFNYLFKNSRVECTPERND